MSGQQSRRTQIRWTPEVVTRALDIIRQHGAPEAARQIGVSYASLSMALRTRGHSIARPETKGETVARLYAARWPVEDIAASAGEPEVPPLKKEKKKEKEKRADSSGAAGQFKKPRPKPPGAGGLERALE